MLTTVRRTDGQRYIKKRVKRCGMIAKWRQLSKETKMIEALYFFLKIILLKKKNPVYCIQTCPALDWCFVTFFRKGLYANEILFYECNLQTTYVLMAEKHNTRPE